MNWIELNWKKESYRNYFKMMMIQFIPVEPNPPCPLIVSLSDFNEIKINFIMNHHMREKILIIICSLAYFALFQFWIVNFLAYELSNAIALVYSEHFLAKIE